MSDRKRIFGQAQRIVVKIGSNILTAENGLNLPIIKSISGQICALIQGGMK